MRLHGRRASWTGERLSTLTLILLLGSLGRDSRVSAATRDEPPRSNSTGAIQSVEVTLLSTMLADRAGVGEWGFAALVEVDGRRILFDTGARPETVLRNAQELKVDLSGVSEVILSHHH